MDKVLKKARRLAELSAEVLGESLSEVYLFGSAARGDYKAGHSDLNLLLVFSKLGREEIRKSAALMKRLGKEVSILCLTTDYINTSLDTFPLEFLDMKLYHQALYGEDKLKGLQIDPAHLRLQIERELKAKLTLLRQSAICGGCSEKTMISLLEDHFSALTAVFQGMIYLRDAEVPAKRKELFARMEAELGIEEGLFENLANLGKKGRLTRGKSAEDTYFALLDTMERLAGEIDDWAPEPAEQSSR